VRKEETTRVFVGWQIILGMKGRISHQKIFLLHCPASIEGSIDNEGISTGALVQDQALRFPPMIGIARLSRDWGNVLGTAVRSKHMKGTFAVDRDPSHHSIQA